MRKNMQTATKTGYKIIAVDDEEGIVDSLSVFLKRSGYDLTGVTDPLEAIELVKNEHFDLMILDFIRLFKMYILFTLLILMKLVILD